MCITEKIVRFDCSENIDRFFELIDEKHVIERDEPLHFIALKDFTKLRNDVSKGAVYMELKKYKKGLSRWEFVDIEELEDRRLSGQGNIVDLNNLLFGDVLLCAWGTAL